MKAIRFNAITYTDEAFAQKNLQRPTSFSVFEHRGFQWLL
jgi:hypothetical protein